MSRDQNRTAIRLTRWLYRHPAVHFVGLVLIAVAALTSRGTTVTLPRVVLGIVLGVAWALWFHKVVMQRAMQNIGE